MLLFLGVPTAIHSWRVSLRRYVGYIGFLHGVCYYFWVSLRRYILFGYPCGDTSDTSDIIMEYITIVVIPAEIHTWWVSLRGYIGYIGY